MHQDMWLVTLQFLRWFLVLLCLIYQLLGAYLTYRDYFVSIVHSTLVFIFMLLLLFTPLKESLKDKDENN